MRGIGYGLTPPTSGLKRLRSITIRTLTAGRDNCSKATAEQGLNTTAHVNGPELALASIIDGFSGIEHAFDIRTYGDVAALIARSGTTHTQTYGAAIYGSLNYMRRRHGWPSDRALLRRFLHPLRGCWHAALDAGRGAAGVWSP